MKTLLIRTPPRFSPCGLLLRGFLLFCLCLPALAEVEAVVLTLTSSSANRSYAPPAGKVLIIEHVMFPQVWADQGWERTFYVRPRSTIGANFNRAGTDGEKLVLPDTYFQVKTVYRSDWNMLSRPLRVPAPSSIHIDSNNAFLQCFIMGRLVDQDDLFASIESEVKDVRLAEPAGAPTLLVDVAVPTKRPAKVRVETSEDLQSWATSNAGRQRSPGEIELRFSPLVGQARFIRAAARVAPEEEYNPDYAFMSVQTLSAP